MATDIANSPISAPVFWFESAELDLMSLGANTTVVPAQGSGKTVIIVGGGLIFTQRTGTATGAGSVKYGTNGAHDNMNSSLVILSTTIINSALTIPFRTNTVPTPLAMPEITSDVVVEVASAVTGTMVLKGKFVYLYITLPSPP